MKTNTSATKKSKLSVNMLLSGFCSPLVMALNYFYVPIVLDYLGEEKYGVWITILNIVSWISYLDVGLGNGLKNRLTESINGNTDNKPQKLISSAYAIITCIVSVTFILFLILAQFLNWEKILGIEDGEEDLKNVILVCMFLVSINFILTLCNSIIFALQKGAFVSLIQLCSQIINFLGAFLLRKYTDASLMKLALLYGISLVLVSIITTVIVFMKHKDFRPLLKEIDYKTGKTLAGLGYKFFIIQICGLVLYATDTVIISYLYGAINVTPYSMANKMFTAVASVFIAFLPPVWTAVTKYKTEGNYYKIENLLKNITLLMIPFFMGAIVLAIFFRPISFLWLRKEIVYSDSLIVLEVIYCFLMIWTNAYATIMNGLEVMKVPVIVSIIIAIINIPLSLLFAIVFRFDINGVLLGTILCMIISAVIQPILVFRKLKELRSADATE